MVRFIPREERFFDCFERQAAYLVDASRRLHDLVYVFSDQAAKAQAIKDLEHLGDQVTREMMTLLNQTFVTPIDREDIHALASRLDDVLDAIDAVAADLVVYRVGEPTSECRAFADVIVDAVADTERAIKCLRRLDPGFHAIAVAVNTLENRSDQLLRQSLAALFDTAPDAIHVLKWKDIYETMEAVTDRCEDVANVVEAILLKMT